jgi:hypothetical protein
VGTIALTILSIDNKDMQELFTKVPFCSYFVNIASKLRDTWIQIDAGIEKLADPNDARFSQVLKCADDSNELLLYISDLFATCKETNSEVCNMLANALLNVAYLPVLVQSLCVLKIPKPALHLSTCLYVLTQTFHILNDTP